ncbi:MAG: phosphoribosylglycinamide synthetase C domain-containing protein, partial [Brachybacterium tyrofermentans]
LLSSGGRVLSVVASGADLEEARVLALAGAEAIALEGCQHRHDIARTAARDARDALSASSAQHSPDAHPAPTLDDGAPA